MRVWLVFSGAEMHLCGVCSSEEKALQLRDWVKQLRPRARVDVEATYVDAGWDVMEYKMRGSEGTA